MRSVRQPDDRQRHDVAGCARGAAVARMNLSLPAAQPGICEDTAHGDERGRGRRSALAADGVGQGPDAKSSGRSGSEREQQAHRDECGKPLDWPATGQSVERGFIRQVSLSQSCCWKGSAE
jgi:hypothetical protein